MLLIMPVFAAWLPAQISPGQLSKSHQALNGATHCDECHEVGQGGFKCASCHQDIGRRVEHKQGLHGAIFRDPTPGRDSCVACHSDHNGKDFELIRWDGPVAAFDHGLTGYWLEDRHSRLDCRKCHQSKNIAPEEAARISTRDLNRTYLGLSRGCISCHADEHRGQVSSNCRSCHNLKGWKEAASFVHALTSYRLDGAHEKVACQKCHPTVPDPKPYVKYKGLPHEDCTPCHKDHHGGAFRASCRSCHVSSGWRSVRDGWVFNHDTTKLPLRGKHVGVACRSCHPNSNFSQDLPHQKCADCHRKDPHQAQFRTAERDPDCGQCHSVEGFKPAVYDVKKHAETRFPLEGKHGDTPCAKCHVPKGPETVYRIDGTRCVNCHKDGHPGLPAVAAGGTQCQDCHTNKAFVPSTYTLPKHAASRFPLTGAHPAVICADCHRKEEKPKREAATGQVVRSRLRLEDFACSSCHADSHRGQFKTAEGTGGSSSTGCVSCHSTSSWSELPGFDHARTEFRLEGAHKLIPCTSCHRSPDFKTTLRDVVFASAGRRCSQCHEDTHRGQFNVAERSQDCADCHGQLAWRPALFDHNKNSSYVLTGAHTEVPCRLCHATSKEIEGRLTRIYKPTPRECRDCHTAEKSE
ncbi:MAG: hypothetical protein EHM61_03365 [Acidobacteria bacterium]|nr:MAG: hypothetical protein EHM61_03365 [Acidobacteriota bacterium]